ncbi:MAG: hypothetical protein NC548_51195, partial [Lachnospiraceae bacterium]|nr:hypothetical protein [Lachnospiraceae bacterium]
HPREYPADTQFNEAAVADSEDIGMLGRHFYKAFAYQRQWHGAGCITLSGCKKICVLMCFIHINKR